MASHVPEADRFDPFDHATFNGLAPLGSVLPDTGIAAYADTSGAFNTSGYTVDSLEERDRTGCAASASLFYFGGKTAWSRLITRVAGTVTVKAKTDYNVILFLYQMPDARPIGGYFFSDLPPALDCNNAASGNDETLQAHVAAGRTVLVQSAGFCGSGANATQGCPDPVNQPLGGNTTMELTFLPDNQDGDGLPDTSDSCPQQAAFTPTGCPDRDLDGIADAADQCPDQKGDPPLGCPPPPPVDVDADGVTRPTDCNDDNPAVHPGARAVPGNGIDDDCDGKPEPFPVVTGETTLAFSGNRRGIVVRSLLVRNVSRGARVELRCRRGKRRACRRQVRKSAGARGGTISFPAMRSKRMQIGTRIEIRVTGSRSIGRFIGYRIRQAGFKRTDRCMDAGSTKPRSRCRTAAF